MLKESLNRNSITIRSTEKYSLKTKTDLNNFIKGIRQSAEISNQLMAVERVLEYRDLEPEKEPKKPLQVSDDWPSKGCIEFENIVYKYFAEAEPVLRELSFVTQPKEKMGKFPHFL